MCTDGLYQPLGETEGLEPILQQNTSDLNAAAAIMFNAIHRRGRLDDTTLILIRIRRIGAKNVAATVPGQTDSAKVAAAGEKSGSRLKTGIIATAVVLVLLMVGMWLFGGDTPDDSQDTAGGATVTEAVVALDFDDLALDAYPTETPAPTATPSPIPTETSTPPPDSNRYPNRRGYTHNTAGRNTDGRNRRATC